MNKTQKNMADIFDKSGSDKQYNHNYSVGYADFFEKRSVKTLLEIGIANHTISQTSLTAWGEIFPDAEIYGIDIDQSKMMNSDRIKTFVVDQSSKAQLTEWSNTINKKFDVIIDDGSHIFSHAKLTFELLFGLLSDDGIYIIEDIAKDMTNWGFDYEQSLDEWKQYLETCTGIKYKIIDCRPDLVDDSIMIEITRDA